MASLDWAAIRTATLVGLIVIGPAIVVASILTDEPDGLLITAFLVTSVVGFVASGAVAGSIRRDTPMLHGFAGAALTALILLVVGAIRSWIEGYDYSIAASVLVLLVASSCGVAGALGADWLRRRRNASRGRGLTSG